MALGKAQLDIASALLIDQLDQEKKFHCMTKTKNCA